MIEIKEAQDPRVAAFCLLKHKEQDRSQFIADHEKTVVRLLLSPLPIRSIFGTPFYLEKHKTLLESKGIPEDQIFVASESVFLETIGFSVHRGFLALAPVPPFWLMQDLTSPILCLSSIHDSENLGALLRTALGFGIQNILLDEKTAFPYLRRVVRVSMGSIFQSRLCITHNLESDLQSLAQEGNEIIGLSLPEPEFQEKSFVLPNFSLPEKYVLVLGNEGHGLSPKTKAVCSALVSIPMQNGVDSFNVSHSLAAFLGFGLKDRSVR